MHCTDLETFCLTSPSGSERVNLAPLLSVPSLQAAYLDPDIDADPTYQELAHRGL